jgi:hypothetical protein
VDRCAAVGLRRWWLPAAVTATRGAGGVGCGPAAVAGVAGHCEVAGVMRVMLMVAEVRVVCCSGVPGRGWLWRRPS